MVSNKKIQTLQITPITLNWAAIIGVGIARWTALQKMWSECDIDESEAWDLVVNHKATFNLPTSILKRVQTHHERFGTNGWSDFLEQYQIHVFFAGKFLYSIGNKSVLQKRCLAVVGTRHPTPSGMTDIEHFLVGFLQATQNRVVISSGMMYGIDEVAHSIAIREKVLTLGVVGGGLLWQQKHDKSGLFEQIKESGGLIVSQFHPEIAPQKGMFVARNTTLAELSHAVVVGEIHEGSGSRHTVAAAKQQQKPVWVLPVGYTHPASKAVADLINTHGVKVISSVHSLAQHFSDSSYENPGIPEKKTESSFRALLAQGATFDHLLATTNFSPSELSKKLITLELAGTIKRRGPEWLLVASSQVRYDGAR